MEYSANIPLLLGPSRSWIMQYRPWPWCPMLCYGGMAWGNMGECGKMGGAAAAPVPAVHQGWMGTAWRGWCSLRRWSLCLQVCATVSIQDDSKWVWKRRTRPFWNTFPFGIWARILKLLAMSSCSHLSICASQGHVAECGQRAAELLHGVRFGWNKVGLKGGH